MVGVVCEGVDLVGRLVVRQQTIDEDGRFV